MQRDCTTGRAYRKTIVRCWPVAAVLLPCFFLQLFAFLSVPRLRLKKASAVTPGMASMAWEHARVLWLGNLPPTLPKTALLSELPSLLGLLDASVRHRGSQQSSAGFLLFASREQRDAAATFLRALGWDARAHACGQPAQTTVPPPAAAAGRLGLNSGQSQASRLDVSRGSHESKSRE